MAEVITLVGRTKTVADRLRSANALAGQAHIQTLAGAAPRTVIDAIGKAMAELTEAHAMLAGQAKEHDRAAKLGSGTKVCSFCNGTGMNLHDAGSIDCPACLGAGLA